MPAAAMNPKVANFTGFMPRSSVRIAASASPANVFHKNLMKPQIKRKWAETDPNTKK
jgi:hypothetical protein